VFFEVLDDHRRALRALGFLGLHDLALGAGPGPKGQGQHRAQALGILAIAQHAQDAHHEGLVDVQIGALHDRERKVWPSCSSLCSHSWHGRTAVRTERCSPRASPTVSGARSYARAPTISSR
jgi:hypothetical protein